MYKVTVNGKAQFEVVAGANSKEGKINNTSYLLDVLSSSSEKIHAIRNNKSYSLEVLTANYDEKSFVIKVNGTKYSVHAKDKFDALLSSLGMDSMAQKKVNNLKAPMPGLVLDIRVQEGAKVQKGDALLVLEAMKMENIIKAVGEGIVKKINVQKGVAVEKNQLLVTFE